MKIAIITGSRADRGPLEMVLAALVHQHKVELFPISVEDHAASGRLEVSAFTGWAVRHIAAFLSAARPDLVILLGDRYEILGAAVASNIMGIPIAHLSGGDVTEGSQDDCFRHAITKLSHLHFATCPESARRIIKMGEEPHRVYSVGCPGVDRILQTALMTKDDALAQLDVHGVEKYLMACLHPNTLGDTKQDLSDLLYVLNYQGSAGFIILVGPNEDAGNDIIRTTLKDFAERNRHAIYHDHLDGPLYLSLLRHASAFVGNSSAVYYEAPTLGTPVIEIGDRQKGRAPHYGDGRAAEHIATIISGIDNPKSLLRKRFYEGSNAWPLTPSGRESTETENGGDIQKRS